MNDLHRQLTQQLITILQDHMAGSGEAALLRAYDLGHSAVAKQLNTLEMLAIQQEALVQVLLQKLGAAESARLTQAAAEVFTENLAPFELATRSFQEGEALLQRVNAELEQQVAERTQALQRERDFAQRLIETAQAIVLVLDVDGRIVRFNSYLAELSGYRLADVQGKNWFTTFIPEHEQSRVREIFTRTVRETRTHRGINAILTRDGREREIEWSSTLLTDASGNALGLLSIGQDVTEHERARAVLRSLIQTTQDAVILIDRHGHIEVFNPAAERIFGYSHAEVVGQNVSMLMPEPYASEHDDYLARYERTGEARAIGRTRTVAARRRTGEVFPIEISVSEVKVGNEVRYGAFIRDISEKVRLQEQLIERERLAAIGATAAKLVHEVGNPLNSMSVATQLLQRRLSKYTLDDNIAVSVRSIMDQITRLSHLLQEFRSLSRRQAFTFQPTNLITVVQDVLTAELPLYSEQGITVEQVFALEVPLVQGDRDKLKQVVLNLCKNAVEAMPKGGTLTVRVHNAGKHLTLEVADTGVGIPEGVNIFEPFVTTKAEGTGLGLAIVWQIVEAHGGTLTYTSAYGQGTTFSVMFPLASPEGKRNGA
jgi:two-component system sensor kinase FixL